MTINRKQPGNPQRLRTKGSVLLTSIRHGIAFGSLLVATCVMLGGRVQAQTHAAGPPQLIPTPVESPIGVAVNLPLDLIMIVDGVGSRILYSTSYSDTAPLWTEFGQLADPSHPDAVISPGAVSVDSHGNIYVVDTSAGRVQLYRWEPANRDYALDPGFATSTSTVVDGKVILRPRDIAVGPDDRVYLLDSGNDRILVADGPDAVSWEVWQQNEQWGNPYGLDVAKDGAIYLADTDNHQILKLNSQGMVATYGHFGTGSGEFRFPRDVAVSADGHLFVADTYNSRVVVLTAEGEYYRTLGGAPLFDSPQSIAVDDNDRIFIADSNRNHLIAYLGPESRRAFDAYIRDNEADTGAEPSAELSNDEFEISSPDILIRHWPDVGPAVVGHDGLQAYQSVRPYLNAENYIYLAVGNRGTQPITGVTAKLYWAYADAIVWSDSDLAFPKDWHSSGFYSSYVNASLNHPTNSIYIPSIEPWQDFHVKSLWAKNIGNPNANAASHMIADTDGNLFVAGITALDSPGEPSGHGYLAKFDLNGNLAWTREISESQRVVAIAANVSGIYVATTSRDQPESCENTTENKVVSQLSKFSDSGDLIWHQQIDRPIDAIDATNSSIFFAGTAMWCRSALFISGKPAYSEKVFDTSMSWLEANTGKEHLLDLVPTDGHAHVSVRTLKVWEDSGQNIVRIFVGGNVNNGNVNLSGVANPPPSDTEAFILERIVKPLPNGSFQFVDLRVSQFGTVGRDSIEAIDIREPDQSRSRWSPTIYIAGTTEGIVQAGTLAPSDEHTGTSSSQSFLVEYEPDLVPIEQTVITEVSSNLAVYRIFVAPSGIYFAGTTQMDGASADIPTWAFIAKYDFNRKKVWEFRDLFSDPGVATGLAVVDSGVYAVGNSVPTIGTSYPVNARLFKVVEPNALIIGPILWHPERDSDAPLGDANLELMVRLVHANDPSHAGVGFAEMVENNNITVKYVRVYQDD